MAEPARVTFRKQVSDGNYGTEAAEFSMDVEDGVAFAQALSFARQQVQAELKRSPSATVRHALEELRKPVAAHIPTGEAYDEDPPF